MHRPVRDVHFRCYQFIKERLRGQIYKIVFILVSKTLIFFYFFSELSHPAFTIYFFTKLRACFHYKTEDLTPLYKLRA